MVLRATRDRRRLRLAGVRWPLSGAKSFNTGQDYGVVVVSPLQ